MRKHSAWSPRCSARAVSAVALSVTIGLGLAAAGCQHESAPAAAPTGAPSSATTSSGNAAPAATKKHRIVYHLSEAGPEKAKFVMTNAQNTITGLGGFQNFEALEIVVHGPAVKTFMSDTIDPDLKEMVSKLVAQGVTLTMCGNTITKMNIDPSKLVSGCNIAKQGGIVRLVELQEQGYAYLRP